MKIYFFEIDPETKLIKAGITYRGKRHVCLVWSCGNCDYLHIGMKIDNTAETLFFSPDQSAAFTSFLASGACSIEYEGGIA